MKFESNRSPGVHFLTSLSVPCLLLAMPPAVCDEILQAKLVNKDNRFHEVHEPEVNVSGNVIVGVMSASACKALTDNSLGIQSYQTGDVKVCLKVTSRDGAYMSRNEYSVNVAAPSVINLPYQSGIQDVVDAYAEHQGAIAVSATIGECDQSATADFYLPAKLDQGSATLKNGSLSIYINGFDATDVFYHIAGTGPDEIFDCNYIEEGRHTAYNFSCEIPGDRLAGPGPREIEISREVYGRELQPVTVRLLSSR